MNASGVTFETITSEPRFAALGGCGWDDLVRAMPRPSPFLLHTWLVEWWRHFGAGAELRVHAAFRDGRLVAALPLIIRRRGGLGIAEFVGGDDSALADVLVAEGEDGTLARSLARRAADGDQHLVDLFGVPASARLLEALGDVPIHVVERVEAPVLDLSRGWGTVYREKTSSKKRNLHSRRRRQLGELGPLAVDVARTADELDVALDDAFRLHELRWRRRPDSSRFATPGGSRFNRAAYTALAAMDVPRIVTLKLDGRAIAFHSYFAFCGTMYTHRLAFDPVLARFSPGLVNTLDTIETAAAEGLRRVEFLGGAERYKLELADGMEPLYEVIGLARGAAGRGLAAARVAAVRLRLRLKRSATLKDLYYSRLPTIDAWWTGGMGAGRKARATRQQSSTRS